MEYSFDLFGWYVPGVCIEGRVTGVVPPEADQHRRPNWTGTEWVLVDYVEPHSVPVDAPADPCAALIDVGSFFDRFGSVRLAVLASENSNVKAIVKDAQSRHWITLTRPDIQASLDIISSIIPALTDEVKQAVLAMPVEPEENLALRRLFFPQTLTN